MKYTFTLLCLLLLLLIMIAAISPLLPEGLLFYIVEITGIVALILLGIFYKKSILTLRTIRSSMQLLREQDFSSRLRKVGNSETDQVVAVFNRMMDQLKNERLKLRERNHFLDMLVDASPMGIIILDLSGNITSLNPAARLFLECDERQAIGHTIENIPTPLAQRMKALKNNDECTLQMNDSHIYHCSRLTFIDRGFEHPFFLIESLTEEMREAEKKAYEKVIRMMSHEVNNTTAAVSSILGTVNDTLRDYPDTDDLQEVLKACVDRCYSMSAFITRFSDVVKIPQPHLLPTPINDLINANRLFLESMCTTHGIRFIISLTPADCLVQADTTLFTQVLVNIVKNAVESIVNQKKGEITIITQASPASIEIKDNGLGIPKTVEERLFSPFFTTKPNGQGIGLLFIREVLIRHHCRFSLKTYEDGFTRFLIKF